MKHLYLLLSVLTIVWSCSKESTPGNGDPDPDPTATLEACFETSRDTLSVGESLTITSCSQGETKYAYTFGNGENSAAKNPVIVYQEGGDFNISLTVSNDDLDTKTFSRKVHVYSAESNYMYPDITTGYSGYPMETGVSPADGSVYFISLLTDNVGAGGSKYYYNALDASFSVTATYIADKPYGSNSAFVNFLPGGNRNFVFSRTLAGLYGTQEVTYNSGWGFVNGVSSAVKHSYGYLPDGSYFLYFGTQDDGGTYKTAVERRNSSGDAFEVFLDDLGEPGSFIGDMIASDNGYIAFGGVFSKNVAAPQISDYRPVLIFLDSDLAVTGHVVFDETALTSKVASCNDLNGSYHLAQLGNGNLVLYGNGELIVADAGGNMIASSYFPGTKNNQALIALGDSFILSTDTYLRKFDATGTQVKEVKYNGNYMPEILEVSNSLFFAAGYDNDGDIQLFFGSCDKDLNLIDLNQ